MGGQLRKFAKSTNPLEQSFDQEQITQGLTTPIESSVTKSLSSKKIEYLPYVGSLFFGVSMSALMQSIVPLEMATGAEIVFAVYCFSLVRSTFQKPAELEPMPDYDREWESLWTDVFDSVPNVARWLEDWFLDSKIKDICLEDGECLGEDDGSTAPCVTAGVCNHDMSKRCRTDEPCRAPGNALDAQADRQCIFGRCSRLSTVGGMRFG